MTVASRFTSAKGTPRNWDILQMFVRAAATYPEKQAKIRKKKLRPRPDQSRAPRRHPLLRLKLRTVPPMPIANQQTRRSHLRSGARQSIDKSASTPRNLKTYSPNQRPQ